MATLTDRPTHVHTHTHRRLDAQRLIDQRATRGERFTTYIVVGLLLVAIALGSLLGAGFFFIPLGFLAAAVLLFFWSLKRVRTRNPVHSDKPTTSERYADGQPLGRAVRNEEYCAECSEEELLDHVDDEEIRHPRDVTPVGREGPPPTVPFP